MILSLIYPRSKHDPSSKTIFYRYSLHMFNAQVIPFQSGKNLKNFSCKEKKKQQHLERDRGKREEVLRVELKAVLRM